MDPTPPTSGSRIQHLGDRLVVEFRPFREQGAIPFMVVFLPFWTAGGIAVICALFGASWTERPQMLFWLCGWAFFEGGMLVGLAWLLRGRTLLIVTPERLEVRQKLGRFARTKAYDATRIETVEAAQVPYDEAEEGPRTDFCLRLINEDKSVAVGDGLSESEAEDIAAVVRELIRPRRWWGEEPEEKWNFPELYRDSAEKRSRAPIVFAGLCVIFIGLALIGSLEQGGDDTSREQPTPASPATSVDAPFLILASANAHAALVSAGRIPLGVPSCSGDPVTRHWVCMARATSSNRILTFRCEGLERAVRCARAPTAARAPRRSGPVRGAPTSTTAGGRSAAP
jgi:hypothetical protein